MLDELLIKGKSFLRERYFLPYLISLLLGLFLNFSGFKRRRTKRGSL